jgi:hypothetical protein
VCKKNKNRNLENEKEEQMKINLKNLHAQRKFWQLHGRLFLCWRFYYVNDNTKIDLENV